MEVRWQAVEISANWGTVAEGGAEEAEPTEAKPRPTLGSASSAPPSAAVPPGLWSSETTTAWAPTLQLIREDGLQRLDLVGLLLGEICNKERV